MTIAALLGSAVVPGIAASGGAIVLPSGAVVPGGDPAFGRVEQTHDAGFDLHPEFRPFGIDTFWNRQPMLAAVPVKIAPDRTSGTTTDPATYISAVPLPFAPQVPGPDTPSY